MCHETFLCNKNVRSGVVNDFSAQIVRDAALVANVVYARHYFLGAKWCSIAWRNRQRFLISSESVQHVCSSRYSYCSFCKNLRPASSWYALVSVSICLLHLRSRRLNSSMQSGSSRENLCPVCFLNSFSQEGCCIQLVFSRCLPRDQFVSNLSSQFTLHETICFQFVSSNCLYGAKFVSNLSSPFVPPRWKFG